MHWRTRLIHTTAQVSGGFKSLAPATHRGSTVVFERLVDAADDWRAGAGYTYGLYGTPTTLELGLRVAEIEQAQHGFVVPGGQAALALVYLAYCRTGSHALVPESAYGPNRELADHLLGGLGIEVEAYDPLVGGDITTLIRPNTGLVWCESPGSITMEVQDVPAIVAAAHAREVSVALDNTYSAGVLFDAFASGVDVSVQAITKYIGGHSDLLLGTVSVNSDEAYERVGSVHRLLGMAVSPDDCALALRGLQTLGVRLERLERTTLAVAEWLRTHPEIALVLHPALPDCPGHEVWQRDFTGSASVFSIVFRPTWDPARITVFVEALKLFKIGYSWGGVTSLVMAYPPLQRSVRDYGGRLVRLNVGLEEAEDLISDLDQAVQLGAPPSGAARSTQLRDLGRSRRGDDWEDTRMTLSGPRPDWLTFDCYGTLIQWDEGLIAAVNHILSRKGRKVDPDAFIVTYERHERRFEQQRPHLSFRDVCAKSLESAMTELSLEFERGDAEILISAIGNIPPFTEVVKTLGRLKAAGFSLAIISNTDDAIIASNVAQLGDHIDQVITAQQAQAYKPSRRIFEYAWTALDTNKDQLVHICASPYADLAAARELDFRTVWIDRGTGRKPLPDYAPDAVVATLDKVPELFAVAGWM